MKSLRTRSLALAGCLVAVAGLSSTGTVHAESWRSATLTLVNAKKVPGFTKGLMPVVQMHTHFNMVPHTTMIVGPGGRMTSMTTTTIVPIVTTSVSMVPVSNAAVATFWTYEIDDGETVYVASRRSHKTLRLPLEGSLRIAIEDDGRTMKVVDADGKERELAIAAKRVKAADTAAAPPAGVATGPEWQVGAVTDVAPLWEAWTYEIDLGDRIYLATKLKKPCRVTLQRPVRVAIHDDELLLLDERGEKEELKIDAVRLNKKEASAR
jgi:hypothetical protein